MTPRAIGYCRVSTDKQADHGVSLDAQAEKCRQWAQLHDHELVDVVVDDGYSGSTLDRPGMQRILALVDRRQPEVEAVVITKLDRLTRSVRDLGYLLELFPKRHVALVSVVDALDTSSASGQLVAHIMGAVSEWERKAIGERTRAALQHLKQQGKRYGQVPYGYRLDGERIVPDEDEQVVVTRAKALRARGKSYRVIADQLSASGYRTRGGSPFVHTAVGRMLSPERFSLV